MVRGESKMEIEWKGTAALRISCDGQDILFDPFVPLSGSKVPITINDFDGYHTIFITHGHVDHIYSLPEIVKRNPDVRIHCTKTPFRVLKKKGIPEKNLVCIDKNQVIEMGIFRIQTYQGKHAVLPKATWKRLKDIIKNKARKNIFMLFRENAICKENGETLFYQLTTNVQGKEKTIDIMGSMNLCDDIDYPTGADALILPYNGWEDNYLPATYCIERLKSKKVYLDHYDDTFPPLTGPLDLLPIKSKYPNLVQELEYRKVVKL